jgi:Arc/MetJ-type ribon-helix-helix transcriptional regulator
MNSLNQGPDGKFISRSEALKAWLPKLLDRALGDEIAQALDVLAGYKEHHAANDLWIAANVLDRQDSHGADYWIKQHTRRRAIAAELRATKERIGKL